MITPIKITIQMAGDIVFSMPPHLYFYKDLMQFIKDLSCFQTGTLCKDCSDCQICRFFKVSGENFTAYPGIFFQINLFEKQTWKEGEILEIHCFLVGNCEEYKEFISLYFSSLTKVFQVEVRAEVTYLPTLSSNLGPEENIQVLTMMEQDDLVEVWNQMSAYYNENYGCSLPLLPGTFQKKGKPTSVTSFPVSVAGRKRVPHGFINTYTFRYPIVLDRTLLEIGIGKWNWIGGGRCALKNRTEM